MRKSQMNLLLGSLEKQGYLRRCRSETDRRQIHLFLTEAGAAAYQSSHRQSRELINAVVQGIGETEAQQLTQQLTAINTLVQQELNRRQQKGTI